MYVDFVEGDTRLVFWVLEGSLRPISPGGLPLERTEKWNLWEDLPPEILEIILRMVPSSSKFKFRSVCKLWKKDLSSASMWQLHSAPNACNLPIPFQCRSICAFQFNSSLAIQVGSPACRESHVQTIDLSFVPSDIMRSQYDMSVQDGLILMKNCPKWGIERVIDIVVVNPFTRTWIKLPSYTLDAAIGECDNYSLKLEVDSSHSSINSSFTVFLLMRVSPIRLRIRANRHPALFERSGLLTYFSKLHIWKFDVRLESSRARDENDPRSCRTRMCMVSDDGSIMRGNVPAVLATVGNANRRVMCIEPDTAFKWNQFNAIMHMEKGYGYVNYGSNFFFVRQGDPVNLQGVDSTYKVEISIYKINRQGRWELFSVMPAEYCESVLLECACEGRGTKVLVLHSFAVVGNHLCLTLATRIEMKNYVLHVVALHMEEVEWHMVSKISYTGNDTLEESNGNPVLLLLEPRLDFFLQSLPSA